MNDLGAALSSWPDTDWDKVLALRDPAAHAEALAEICKTYHGVFLRVLRHWDNQHAEDMAQEFILGLIKHDSLQRVDPELGRFRQYVGRMLTNFARKQHRFRHCQKRGDGAEHLSISEEMSVTDPPGTEVFDHEWARVLVDRVIADFKAEGTCPHVLRMALRELAAEKTPPASSYKELAAITGTLESTLRGEVARARSRFVERLKQEVALTTVRSQIDEELRYLMRALSSRARAAE